MSNPEEHCDDESLYSSNGPESPANLSGFSNLSFLSEHSYNLSAGQPTAPTNSRRGRANCGLAGPSNAKKSRKRQPTVRCSDCGADVAQGKLNNHLMKHNFEKCKPYLPDDEELLRGVSEWTPTVLQSLKGKQPFYEGDTATERTKVVAEGVLDAFGTPDSESASSEVMVLFMISISMSICEVFSKRSIDTKEPQDLHFMWEEGVSAIFFTNANYMRSLVQLIKQIVDGTNLTDKQASIFLHSFITGLGEKMVCFLSSRMLKGVAPVDVPPSNPVVPESMAAALYHVIGSVVHSDGKHQPSNSNSRLGTELFTDGAGTVANHITNFTSSQNRGALELCNIQTYRFAKALIIALQATAFRQILDGNSTSHNGLITDLTENKELLKQWKTVVGDKYSTDSSSHSFVFYVTKLTNTFMNGIRLLIMNAKVPKGGIFRALRGNLAGGSTASNV